jgi:hypothetical protein
VACHDDLLMENESEFGRSSFDKCNAKGST